MAQFYLDHDVSPYLVLLLEGEGHVATTAHNQGLVAAEDEVQLLTGAGRQAILVTCNRRDFVVLHRAWTLWSTTFKAALPPHGGILAIAQAQLDEQFRALNSLLTSAATEDLSNRMLWWPLEQGWQEWIGGVWTPLAA